MVAGRDVAVHGRYHRRVTVSEHVSDLEQAHTASYERRCHRVPQVVNAITGQARLFARRRSVLVDASLVKWATPGGTKDQAVAEPYIRLALVPFLAVLLSSKSL
jgi:hypothetical protein